MRITKSSFAVLILLISFFLSSCTVTPAGGNVIPENISAENGEKTKEAALPDEYGYVRWVDNAYKFLEGITIEKDGASHLITDDSSTLAWSTAYYLDAFYRGYCATGDIAFLDQFSIYAYRVYGLMADKDGDGYLSWGCEGELDEKVYPYNEYAVHVGLFTAVVGEFVCLVYGDPELAQKETPMGLTYGEMAEYFIDRTVNHALPSFDCDWREDLGVYMNRPGSNNFSGTTEEVSLPHNQYLVMAEAMMRFAMVSPEHREEYVRKAEKMLSVFESKVKYYPNVGVAVWRYKDPLFEGDLTGNIEDFSHGTMDVRTAIVGYENGLVFSLEEINAFAKSYDALMFRERDGDPYFTQLVNGTDTWDGRIDTFMYDMSVYCENMVTRGITYRLISGTEGCFDAARIIAFHPDTPAPENFTLSAPDVSTDNAVFLWQRAAHANYYRIEIAEDSDFSSIIVSRDKIINSGVMVDGLPAGRELYVRVTAMNIKGESVLSNTVNFRITEI